MELKVGTILIAEDSCVMYDSKFHALIIGKEYPITATSKDSFTIISEIGEDHSYDYDELTDFFRIKSDKIITGSLGEALLIQVDKIEKELQQLKKEIIEYAKD